MSQAKRAVYIFLGWLVGVGLFFVPISGYIEAPGNATPLNMFIKVNSQTTNTSNYDLMTVQIVPATLGNFVYSLIDPTETFETQDAITGGQSEQEFEKIQTYYMNASSIAAKQVAFHAAGKDNDIQVNYKGIYVMSIVDNSDFKNKLKVGDTITKVDGQHFDNAKGYQDYLASRQDGQEVQIEFSRDGKTQTTSGKTIVLPNSKNEQSPNGRVGIGISLVDDLSVVTTPDVQFNIENIGGPSGGLMMSLQIYDDIASTPLAKGRMIAGTGTIDANGTVGEIGGVDKKIIAAQKAGAKIFFVPYVESEPDGSKTNYQEAQEAVKKFAPDMTLVPVKTFDDAKKYLETH